MLHLTLQEQLHDKFNPSPRCVCVRSVGILLSQAHVTKHSHTHSC